MDVHRFDKDPACRNQREKFCGNNPTQFMCYGDSGSPLGVQLLDNKCIPPKYAPRIIGGQNAGRAPWMAYLMRNRAFVGGGSLIAYRFVLTAAHCSKLNETLFVRLGEYDLSTTRDGKTQDYRAVDIYRHPYYNAVTQVNDIALLKLDRPVIYTATIRPICILLSPGVRFVINKIKLFTVTGWGQASRYPRMPTKLQQMTVRRYSYSHCYNQPGKLCASNPAQFACKGDAGSPLGAQVRYNGTTIFAQFGVASTFTDNCKAYGIYTDLLYHTHWIAETMQHNWY
ncbi:uncharacterized protein Dyak_GE11796 [Drosophila yakuba]|uniref:Peptidase S1 domain-containing protein n=1 Tax=Drosophila yakuba TaxID=7245 RepID=B4P664_DROYA|nr:uncharacterized protein Dyak_GE11796 [Drosophila yakuba]